MAVGNSPGLEPQAETTLYDAGSFSLYYDNHFIAAEVARIPIGLLLKSLQSTHFATL